MTVHYKIDGGKLEAQNQIFLDQLTFGEKVDSPDATKLPVLFAVSLLKNRRGEIDIKLPISGSLDDPQFSVGGIIWRVIVNLITKAVMAPFSLLSPLIGPAIDRIAGGRRWMIIGSLALRSLFAFLLITNFDDLPSSSRPPAVPTRRWMCPACVPPMWTA